MRKGTLYLLLNILIPVITVGIGAPGIGSLIAGITKNHTYYLTSGIIQIVAWYVHLLIAGGLWVIGLGFLMLPVSLGLWIWTLVDGINMNTNITETFS